MSFDVKENGSYVKKTVYVILGVKLDGKKELLGLWIGEKETSKYWLSVLNDLKTRGVEDVLIACVDGLNGFEQAVKSVYPNTCSYYQELYKVCKIQGQKIIVC